MPFERSLDRSIQIRIRPADLQRSEFHLQGPCGSLIIPVARCGDRLTRIHKDPHPRKFWYHVFEKLQTFCA